MKTKIIIKIWKDQALIVFICARKLIKPWKIKPTKKKLIIIVTIIIMNVYDNNSDKKIAVREMRALNKDNQATNKSP